MQRGLEYATAFSALIPCTPLPASSVEMQTCTNRWCDEGSAWEIEIGRRRCARQWQSAIRIATAGANFEGSADGCTILGFAADLPLPLTPNTLAPPNTTPLYHNMTPEWLERVSGVAVGYMGARLGDPVSNNDCQRWEVREGFCRESQFRALPVGRFVACCSALTCFIHALLSEGCVDSIYFVLFRAFNRCLPECTLQQQAL